MRVNVDDYLKKFPPRVHLFFLTDQTSNLQIKISLNVNLFLKQIF